ncbi:hypothetical protein [Candidatus Magnetominusculus dajiuhuensis]|uniref:hypothetical protein n=1 Tax=Candidatus Magnetominusculus dajiuhuensis TaxID=3137712 RepID=UPI003B428A11
MIKKIYAMIIFLILIRMMPVDSYSADNKYFSILSLNSSVVRNEAIKIMLFLPVKSSEYSRWKFCLNSNGTINENEEGTLGNVAVMRSKDIVVSKEGNYRAILLLTDDNNTIVTAKTEEIKVTDSRADKILINIISIVFATVTGFGIYWLRLLLTNWHSNKIKEKYFNEILSCLIRIIRENIKSNKRDFNLPDWLTDPQSSTYTDIILKKYRDIFFEIRESILSYKKQHSTANELEDTLTKHGL